MEPLTIKVEGLNFHHILIVLVHINSSGIEAKLHNLSYCPATSEHTIALLLLQFLSMTDSIMLDSARNLE